MAYELQPIKRIPDDWYRPHSYLTAYGFKSFFSLPNSPRMALIALGHLAKLSQQNPQVKEIREKVIRVVERIGGDGEEVKILKRVLEDMQAGWVDVWKRAEQHTFVNTMESAYNKLLSSVSSSHPSPPENLLEFTLFKSLGLYLLSFYPDKNPVRINPANISLFVTISLIPSTEGVLIHYKEANPTDKDFKVFPLVHDARELKDKKKNIVQGRILEVMKRLVELTEARWDTNEVNKVEKARMSIAELEQDYFQIGNRRDAPYTSLFSTITHTNSHSFLTSAFGSPRPHLYPFKFEDSHPESETHPTTPRPYAHRRAFSSSVTEGGARPYPSTLSAVLEDSPQTSVHISHCELCGRNGREKVEIGECSCYCTECWQKYIATYVFLPDTVNCMKCGQTVKANEIVKKLGLEMVRCGSVKCKRMMEKKTLRKVACKRECEVCCLCFQREFGFLPGSILDKHEQVQNCAFCKESNLKESLECCGRRKEGGITSKSCGHRVHVDCIHHGLCPVCQQRKSERSANRI